MKNVFCLALAICFCAVSSVAQEQVITQSEFESAVRRGQNHRAIWKGEKFRMTVTTSSKAVGRPETDWSSTMISEYGSPEEGRTITSSTFAGKTKPKYEWVRVGPWSYSRVDNGSWTKKEYVAPESPEKKNETPPTVIRQNSEYKYLGDGVIAGKAVKIYTRTEQRTTTSKESGENTQTDTKSTYWVDSNGTILKEEHAFENRGPKVTSHTFITTAWELDPSISFVPPEITS